MTPRPIIFISSVSKELKSARQLVSNTLQFIGYEPDWQDVFGTEQGDLRAMLRRKIDSSQGVVQLVGKCYGAEPREPDERFGRISYTQYEALYARERGKKVWYLFLDDGFPSDAHDPESEELRELQATYIRRVRALSDVRTPVRNSEGLEASVLKLRDDLTQLRRGMKRWAAAVMVLLIVITGIGVWLEEGQRHERTDVAAVKDEMSQLRQGLLQFSDVQSKSASPNRTKARKNCSNTPTRSWANNWASIPSSSKPNCPSSQRNFKPHRTPPPWSAPTPPTSTPITRRPNASP